MYQAVKFKKKVVLFLNNILNVYYLIPYGYNSVPEDLIQKKNLYLFI